MKRELGVERDLCAREVWEINGSFEQLLWSGGSWIRSNILRFSMFLESWRC